MDHIRVNLTNVAIITLSAGIGLGAMMFVLVWLGRNNWPIVTPVANSLLAIWRQIPPA